MIISPNELKNNINMTAKIFFKNETLLRSFNIKIKVPIKIKLEMALGRNISAVKLKIHNKKA